MEGTVAGAGGAALWYRDEGSGSDVVVVPGAVVDADLELLCRPGRRVVFYDTCGRGRSETVAPARLDFAGEVADVAAVRAGLGLERTALLGWSYLAGVVALDAVAHPGRVSRLVLVAPVGVRFESGGGPIEAPPGVLAHLDQLRAAGVDRDDPERFCEEWRRAYLPLQLADPGSLARVRSRPCRHANEWPDRVTATLAHLFVDLGPYDWRDRLALLEVPTLVVHGEADAGNREAAEEWVLTLPDARLLTVRGAGRLPWVEAPDAFGEAVDAFLGGGWPAGSVR